MDQRGLTILELLIVLGIIAVLTVVSIMLFAPSASRRAAQDLQRLYLGARNRAIMHREHIAVVPANAANTRWELRRVGSYMQCENGEVLLSTSLYGNAFIQVVPRNTQNGTLVWTPHGSPRACNAQLPNQTIEIAGGPTVHKVVISSLGRVNIEAVQ